MSEGQEQGGVQLQEIHANINEVTGKMQNNVAMMVDRGEQSEIIKNVVCYAFCRLKRILF